MADYKTTGGCLCGGVRFEISMKPVQILHCHCSMCRKTIGSAFGTFVAIRHPEGFRFLIKDTLKEYESSPGLKRMFCGRCGCSIHCKHVIEPNTIRVNAGAIDGDLGAPIDCHIYVGSKAPWVQINDGVPASDEMQLWRKNPAE